MITKCGLGLTIYLPTCIPIKNILTGDQLSVYKIMKGTDCPHTAFLCGDKLSGDQLTVYRIFLSISVLRSNSYNSVLIFYAIIVWCIFNAYNMFA